MLELVNSISKEDAKFIRSIKEEDDRLLFKYYPDNILDETMAASTKDIGRKPNNKNEYRYVLISMGEKAKHGAGRLKVTNFGNSNTRDHNNTTSFFVTNEKKNIVETEHLEATNMTREEVEYFKTLTLRNWNLIKFCRTHSGLDQECMNAFIRDEQRRLNGIDVVRDPITGNATYLQNDEIKVWIGNGPGYYPKYIRSLVTEDIYGNIINKEVL